jgi:hypothetical protein
MRVAQFGMAQAFTKLISRGGYRNVVLQSLASMPMISLFRDVHFT